MIEQKKKNPILFPDLYSEIAFPLVLMKKQIC